MTDYRGIPIQEIRRLKPPKVLFPNEHGAWALLTTAFLLGWLAAPEFSWRPWYLLPAAIGAFLARYPAGIYFKKRRVTRALKIPLIREKRWFLIYSLATFVVAFPLFYPLGWWWLLGFVFPSILSLGLHLWAIIKRKERTLFVEATAMLGLTFLCPAASYAAVLELKKESILIWLLLISYNLHRIISIRRKVTHRNIEPVNLRQLGRREIGYAMIFISLVVVIVRALHR